MIWVQRKAASRRPVASSLTRASQTWVVRPPCRSRASQTPGALGQRAHEVALHLDGGEPVRPLGPSGGDPVSAEDVGDREHHAGQQIAGVRDQVRPHLETAGHPPGLDFGDPQAKVFRQLADVRAAQIFQRGSIGRVGQDLLRYRAGSLVPDLGYGTVKPGV